MAKLWKRLPIMLSIAVAVIAVVDVSCSGYNVRSGSITMDSPHRQELDYNELSVNENGNSYNAPVPQRRGLFGKNWKLIGLYSLVFLLVVNLLGAMVLNSGKSSNSVQVLGEQAERGRLGMQTSNDTMKKLQNITQRLTTPLSSIREFPPLDLNYDYPIPEEDSTSDDATEMDTTKSDTTGKYNAEDTTTGNYTTNDPTTTTATTTEATTVITTVNPQAACLPTGRAVYKLIESILPKFRKTIYAFDESEKILAENIKEELRPVIMRQCGNDFFYMRRENGHDILHFDDKNPFVKEVIKSFRCEKVAREVIPILQFRSGVHMSGFTYYHVMESDETKYQVMKTIDYSKANQCGTNFFHYRDYGNILVTYYATNEPTINREWTLYDNTRKCQVASDAIIFVLNQKHLKTSIVNAKNTIQDRDGVRDIILDAYSPVRDCDCAEGSVKVEEHENSLVVTYKSTNRFVKKSWAELNTTIKCRNIAADVFNYLLELNIYSRNQYTVVTIPDRNDNIRTLIEKLDLNRQYSCGKGFFTHREHGNQFRLSYDRRNERINVPWKKLSQERVCELVADKVIPYISANGFHSNDITPSFTTGHIEVGRQVRSWILSADKSVCGEDYLHTSMSGYNYKFGFDTRNKYIPSSWKENSAKILCPQVATDIVALLEQLDAYTTLNSAQNTYYDCDVEGYYMANRIKSVGNLDCGEGFFKVSYLPYKIRFNYENSNPYIKEAWAPLLQKMECRQAAEEVAWVLDDKGRQYHNAFTDETFHRWRYSLIALDRVGKLVQNKECGNGYYLFQKGMMFDNFKYHGQNSYVKASWMKLRRDRTCSPAAKVVVEILHKMRLYDNLRREDTITIFTAEDLDRISRALRTTGGVDCDDNFPTIVEKHGRKIVDYHPSNKFMRRAWAESLGQVPLTS